jgi:hypothetical protein
VNRTAGASAVLSLEGGQHQQVSEVGCGDGKVARRVGRIEASTVEELLAVKPHDFLHSRRSRERHRRRIHTAPGADEERIVEEDA